MPKLTRTQSRNALLFVQKRDGNGCQMAPGKKSHDGHKCKGPSILDHIDNDPENNPKDGSNFQELCKGHNARKNPRGRGRFHKVLHGRGKNIRETEREWENDRLKVETLALKLNLEREPLFRLAAKRIVAKHGIVNRKDLIDACCEACGASYQTGCRYLDKLAARYAEEAPLEYVAGRELKARNPALEGLRDDETYVKLKG